MTDMIRSGLIRSGPEVIWHCPVIRHCPDCGSDQPFEQHHPAPACCPDSGGGDCPEWSCAACGAALLTGFIPPAREIAGYREARGRVA